MSTPITFEGWIKSKSARVNLIISGFFTFCLAILPMLRLFGIDQISMPNLLKTNKGWLIVNILIQGLFTLYVTFGTAYKYSELKNAEKTDPEEFGYWQNLELQDPTTGERKEKVEEDDWIKFKLKVNKVAKQFAWFWFLGWLSWIFHYGYLFLTSINVLDEYGFVSNFVNNLNSLMFIFLFMTLTVSTSKRGGLFWLKLSCIVIGFFIFEWVISQNLEGNIIVVLSFTLISGLFASVALGAFIGSIDSKFINLPVWLVSVLYFYAALQSLYVVFVLRGAIESLYTRINTEDIQKAGPAIQPFLEKAQAILPQILNFLEVAGIAIILLAFILKAILFVTVTWMLRTGRLIYFIIEEGSLNYKRDRNFAEFTKTIKISESRL